MLQLPAILFAISAGIASVSADYCSAGQYASLLRFNNGARCQNTGFYLPGQSSDDTSFPSGDRLYRVCTSDSCLALFDQLNATFPRECDVGNAIPLRATYLDKFAVACAPVELNGVCGSDQLGPKRCSNGQYCQPWNPTSYQCRSFDAKCGIQEVGVDYTGDDLATVQVALPEDCCSRCAGTIGCTGYTFVNYNPDGKAYCYLKKGQGTKTNKVGAVSAMIVQPRTCPAQAPAKCTRQLTNVDLFGKDVAAVTSVTAGECCDKCAATAGCKAYTYVSTTNACYLKSGAGELRLSFGVVSGMTN